MKLIMTNLAAVATLAALVGGAYAGPLAAQSPAKSTTTKASVTVGNLDLSTEAARSAAQIRVNKTVQHLCLQLADDRRVDFRVAYEECSREARAQAQRQLDALVRLATRATADAELSAR